MRRYFAITAIILLLAATAAAAETPLARFESKILLNQDSSAVIVEHVTFQKLAPVPWKRELRVYSSGILGSRERLLIDVLEVTDGVGKPIRYGVADDRGSLRIYIMHAVPEAKISYAVRNAIHYYNDHDEFLWPANPPQTAVDSMAVQVVLPELAAGQFRGQAVLRGESDEVPAEARWSSGGQLPARIAGSTLDAASPGPLAPGVALVVDVFAPTGVFKRIGPLTRAWWFAGNNSILLFPLAVWGLMLLVKRVKGGNADPGRSVAPMYAPPENLTPAECGLLIDDSFDPRDVAATLIDLAVRGYVRIEDAEPQEGLVADHRDFVLRLLKPQSEWLRTMPLVDAQGQFSSAIAMPGTGPSPLAPFEEATLFHTFYGGHWTKLSSLCQRFPEIVPGLRREIMNSLRDKGMYRIDPQQAQKWRQVALAVAAVALVAAQQLGVISLFDSPLLAALSLAASAIIVFLYGRKMTAKTLRGMKAYVALLGFEEFISKVEGDALERQDQQHLEKLLPYAMALGVEHRWARQFEGIAQQAPEWYSLAGETMFDAVRFGHRMGMFSAITQPMPHLPYSHPTIPGAARGVSA